MKKEINFEFDGNKYKVDVESDGENLVITKDGKTYNVKLIGGAAKKPAPRKAPAARCSAADLSAVRFRSARFVFQRQLRQSRQYPLPRQIPAQAVYPIPFPYPYPYSKFCRQPFCTILYPHLSVLHQRFAR